MMSTEDMQSLSINRVIAFSTIGTFRPAIVSERQHTDHYWTTLAQPSHPSVTHSRTGHSGYETAIIPYHTDQRPNDDTSSVETLRSTNRSDRISGRPIIPLILQPLVVVVLGLTAANWLCCTPLTIPNQPTKHPPCVCSSWSFVLC